MPVAITVGPPVLTINQGSTFELVVSRTVGEGLHEDLDVTNYGPAPVRFQLEIALRSDFADLFEVKSGRLVRRGSIVTAWDQRRTELRTSYSHGDFRRRFLYRVRHYGSRP